MKHVPDQREIEDPIGIVKKLMKALHAGARRIPKLKPEVVSHLVWFKDTERTCSLCGAEIGRGPNDPGWSTHAPRCAGCELCEFPIMLFQMSDRGTLRFHSVCFLKATRWKDWTDLRIPK